MERDVRTGEQRPVPAATTAVAAGEHELAAQFVSRSRSARQADGRASGPLSPPGGEPAADATGRGRPGPPVAALSERAALGIQRCAGNTAMQQVLRGGGRTIGEADDAVQRVPEVQRQPDLLDALILGDWPRAATLLEQLNDADLAARIADESPERLLLLQRAAVQARATRVVQAIQNVQLRTGTQVANVEGTTFRTPVTLFQNGVVISRDIRFVRRGRFRSDGDFEHLKNRIIDAVRTNLTARFRLRIETPGGGAPQPGDGEYTIRVIVVDNPSAAYRLNLHGQRHGRGSVGTNSGNIFELGQANETETPDTYLAHECAHILLGANDEYADASVPARQVFTDNSVMGDFYNEGMDQAELKPRHFGALVQLVSGWFPGRTVSIVE